MFSGIPGLFVYPDHFDEALCALLVRQSLELHTRLEEAITRSGTAEKVRIPQPEFVRSEKHNLSSEELYTKLVLAESNQRLVRCEYFPKYGEVGHALCYFRGNANLPNFVRDGLLPPIRQSIEQDGLVTAGQGLTWKLTMNFYKSVGGTVAGFPFHVDIPTNGVVTMILNIHKEVLVQIAKGEAVMDIQLPVGSLLLLSGESRYEWKHRVLPMPSTGSPSAGGVERVSLVLGFH